MKHIVKHLCVIELFLALSIKWSYLIPRICNWCNYAYSQYFNKSHLMLIFSLHEQRSSELYRSYFVCRRLFVRRRVSLIFHLKAYSSYSFHLIFIELGIYDHRAKCASELCSNRKFDTWGHREGQLRGYIRSKSNFKSLRTPPSNVS